VSVAPDVDVVGDDLPPEPPGVAPPLAQGDLPPPELSEHDRMATARHSAARFVVVNGNIEHEGRSKAHPLTYIS
jgi:hypothetical protein